MIKISLWHHYTLNQFSKEIRKKDLLFDDLIEEITMDDGDYWVFKLGNFKCLYASSKISKLPISLISPLHEPNAYSKVNLGNKIFYKLLHYNTRKIRAEKTLTPYDFFNKFSNLEHNNQLHYKLYKALNLGGYFARINVRVASESEFGKNGVTKTLKYLTNNTRVITPASYPALLRGLPTTRVLNITEPKEFEGFDTFLEQAGDRDVSFENPKLESRGHQTHNEYDISRLSVLLTYNILNYYQDKKQEDKFFDNVFRYHIQSRYIPFMFKGSLNHIEKQDLNDEVYNEILEWLRNFYYYGENWQKYLHNYSVDLSRMKWGIRYMESFEQITKFIDFISKDEKEFYNMVDELIRCHIAYMRMIEGNSVTLYDSIVPKRAEPIKDFEHLQPEIIDIGEGVGFSGLSPLFLYPPPQEKTLKYEDFKQGVFKLFNGRDLLPMEEINKAYPYVDEMAIEMAIQRLKNESEVFEARAGFLKRLM